MKPMTITPAGNAKLQYIDNLRAIAIIMVIITHADVYIKGLSAPFIMLADFGQIGVQLFFLVSAFTLCLTLDKKKGEDKSLKKFYIRRYFRIAPLYYFGIVLYVFYFCMLQPFLNVEATVVESKYSITNILANLLLVNDMVPGPANNKIVPGGWSIGTETTFYAIFPLIFMLYKKYGSSNRSLIVLSLAGLALCFGLVLAAMSITGLSIRNNSFLYFNIICQLPVFLLGISLYFYLKNKPDINRSKPHAYLLGFIVTIIVAVMTFVYFKEMAFLVPTMAGVCFLFLFMLFKHVSFLNNHLLSRIGQLSYSIYLFHFIFAWEGSRILNQQLGGFAAPELIFAINVFLTLGSSIVLATVSERFIEKPGIAWGQAIIQKLGVKNTNPYGSASPRIIMKQDLNRELGVN